MVIRVGPLRVMSGFPHEGTPRRLVHRLKYGGVMPAARLLAAGMAPLVGPEHTAFAPVPRVLARRLRYGIDPAVELCAALSRLTGLPTIRTLSASLWVARHAGSSRAGRGAVRFRAHDATEAGLVLVDDVVTTGATLKGAFDVLDGRPALALTATMAGRMNGEMASSGGSWR